MRAWLLTLHHISKSCVALSKWSAVEMSQALQLSRSALSSIYTHYVHMCCRCVQRIIHWNVLAIPIYNQLSFHIKIPMTLKSKVKVPSFQLLCLALDPTQQARSIQKQFFCFAVCLALNLSLCFAGDRWRNQQEKQKEGQQGFYICLHCELRASICKPL